MKTYVLLPLALTIVIIAAVMCLQQWFPSIDVGEIIMQLIVLSPLVVWIILRTYMFYLERSGHNAPLLSDLYPVSAGIARVVLIVVAGLILFFSVPAYFAIAMARAFNPRSEDTITIWCLFSLDIYALAAIVMNIPFFPLKWHLKAFYPVQILLMPLLFVIIFLDSSYSSLLLLLPCAAYIAFWRICLYDRKKAESMKEEILDASSS